MRPEDEATSRARLAAAIPKLAAQGWRHVGHEGNPWLFSKGVRVYDLSGANLDMLDYIERHGHFVVEPIGAEVGVW